ncbi:unnamed protein product [Durusdinium trenchii]|uniref:Uncharacterized protein n=1 Tax=Durusdinium trenchii TaxID=1381693 RepID=A0ABP0H8I2_9DINO
MSLTQKDLEELARTKTVLLKEFFQAEPPSTKGEDILELWRQIYDEVVQSTVIETVQGPSDVNNPVFPYEKLQAMVGDGGHWKWPRIWRRFDELERRGTAYRRGDPVNFEIPNSNPNIVPQSILIVGGGPVGLRLAIELKLGGHEVTIFEKRREVRNSHGELQQLGFTNRINRPHVFNFLRNDLDRLNGRDFMSSKMCYPVFTQGDTSSIGIDELQLLLMKNALLLGVDFQLGMSYEDAEVTLDPKSQKPQWQVTFSCDDLAAEQRGMAPGRHVRKFDILMGCDGARSRVRESQHRIFGDVDKRNFKKMIGVVANLQKVSRQRLKELGFPSGQEPTDMKRAHLASGAGNMAGLNYYKASYHNYVIFTPSKEDLQQAGFGGSVYSFHAGRDKVNPNKLEEKLHLKQWVLERCKEVGIPVDESLSNGGFVEAPNDVMAFDFSEIWKCKKNFAFNLPPPGYDADVHGPWTGASLVPPIGLVGDSVTEPFWIAGVGLQRGWNGAMDACYLIDNLYNMSFSGESEPLEITSWNEHVQKLQAMIPKLYDCSHDGRMTREGLQGEHADQGVVMMQLNKQMKDCEKPQWQLHVDPFYRYEQFAKQVEEKYRGAKILENMHPVVRRTLAIRKPLEGEKSEQSFSRKLLSVNGKELAMVPEAFDHVPKQKESVDAVPVTRIPDMGFVISEPEVARRATEKSENLQAMLSKQIDVHLQRSSSSTAAFDDERWVPISPKQGFAELAEKQWDVMTEKHLSPTQRAELLHIRNMIKSLNHQIAAIDVPLPYFDALAEQLEMRAEQVYDRVTAVEKALATYNRQVSGVPVSAQIEAVVRSEFLQFKAIAAELVQTLLEVCLVSTLEQVSLEDSSIPVGACLARTLVEDSSVPILVEACSAARTLVEDSSVPILVEACSVARTLAEDSSAPILAEACSVARTLAEDSSVPILVEACSVRTLVGDSLVPILVEVCLVPTLVEVCSESSCPIDCRKRCLDATGQKVILHEDITNTYMIELPGIFDWELLDEAPTVTSFTLDPTEVEEREKEILVARLTPSLAPRVTMPAQAQEEALLRQPRPGNGRSARSAGPPIPPAGEVRRRNGAWQKVKVTGPLKIPDWATMPTGARFGSSYTLKELWNIWNYMPIMIKFEDHQKAKRETIDFLVKIDAAIPKSKEQWRMVYRQMGKLLPDPLQAFSKGTSVLPSLLIGWAFTLEPAFAIGTAGRRSFSLQTPYTRAYLQAPHSAQALYTFWGITPAQQDGETLVALLLKVTGNEAEAVLLPSGHFLRHTLPPDPADGPVVGVMPTPCLESVGLSCLAQLTRQWLRVSWNKDLLGDARFRTLRICCVAYEQLLKLGFTRFLWTEGLGGYALSAMLFSAVFWEDNYVIAIYPNTPLALIHDHLQYVKAKEWLDAKSKLVNIRALLINAEVGRPRLQMFSFHIALLAILGESMFDSMSRFSDDVRTAYESVAAHQVQDMPADTNNDGLALIEKADNMNEYMGNFRIVTDRQRSDAALMLNNPQALPEMPDEIKEDDLLVSMDDLAAADGQRAMKMALSCKMAIDQAWIAAKSSAHGYKVKALHDGTDETGGPDHPGSGWVKKLADEMAEQNHLMMKLQSKLMLVEKQWQALATKAASARF